MLYQTSALRIVDISCDRAVLDLLHRVVDHEQRHEEPFTRNDGIAEPVLDLDIEPPWLEDTVDDALATRERLLAQAAPEATEAMPA